MAVAAGYGREAVEAGWHLGEVTAIMRARRLESEFAAQLGSVDRFTAALGALCRNPTEAQVAFESLAVRHGAAHTADMMRQYPWLFGALREPHAPSRMQREAASRAATLGVEAIRDLVRPNSDSRAAGRAPDVPTERAVAAATGSRRRSISSPTEAGCPWEWR